MAGARDVEDFHNRSDKDSSDQAQHHTIGTRPGQAASGDKFGKLLTALNADGMFNIGKVFWSLDQEETDYLKMMNGQELAVADYPELFDYFETNLGDGYFFGGAADVFDLPDMVSVGRGLINFSDGTGLDFTTGTFVGAQTVNVKHTHQVNVPSHTHSTPNHTHTDNFGTGTVPHTGTTNTSTGGGGTRVNTINGTNDGNHSHSVTGGVTSSGSGTTGTHDEAAFATESVGTAWEADFFDTESFVMYHPSLAGVFMMRVKNPLDGLV